MNVSVQGEVHIRVVNAFGAMRELGSIQNGTG